MGHLNILVIGDDFRDQLDKFQRADYAYPESRHWIVCNLLDGQRRPGMPAPGSDNDAWRQWIASAHVPLIEPDQVLDLFGEHKWGWARMAADGTVLELVERTIPDAFLDWFEGTVAHLTLKPGATGESIDVDGSEEVTRVVKGTAGRALKRDVDFAAMLGPLRAEAAAWWDRVYAACGSTTWQTYAEIRAAFPQPYSREIETAVMTRWCAQQPVEAIVAALRKGQPSYMSVPHDWHTPRVQVYVDAMRVQRADYVARFGLRKVTRCAYVIANGMLLDQRSQAQVDALVDAAPDDTWLTVVHVHA